VVPDAAGHRAVDVVVVLAKLAAGSTPASTNRAVASGPNVRRKMGAPALSQP
jgi:hypothetical protein